MDDNQRSTLGLKSNGNSNHSSTSSGKVSSLPDFNIKVITKDLFDKTADSCAKILSDDKRTNKGTQLRRFYDELVLWYEKVGSDDEAFKNYLPFIYMMKSKVAYAKGRKNVNEEFQNFMKKLIDQITDRTTLKNAKLFMEAMMGFYKQYREND